MKFLKTIDVFKAPVEMFIHRHNKKLNKKTHTPHFGSKCGGLLAVVAIVCLVGYSITSVNQMNSGIKDTTVSKVMVNNFIDYDETHINMSSSNWVPSINMRV